MGRLHRGRGLLRNPVAAMVKLLCTFLLVCASWLPASSFASFPATQTNPGACTVGPCTEWKANNGATWRSTNLDACWDFLSANGSSAYKYPSPGVPAANPSRFEYAYDGGNYSLGYGGGCYIYNHVAGSTNWGASATTSGTITSRAAAPVAATYSCASGAALAGSTCTCTAPTSSQVGTGSGSTCVDPNATRCQTFTGGSDLFTGFTPTPTMGAAFCPSDGTASSCAATVTGGFAIVKNGVKTWTYEVTYGGTTCTPPAAGTTGTQTECKGSVGTVNGVTTCVPVTDRNTIEAIKSTTATNPVGAASAPGSAGSTTTTDQTSCTGSKCSTTTVTTVTPAGGGTPTVTTETKDQPKDDFCKDNPRSLACKEINLGELSEGTVAASTVNLAINKAAAFGPEDGTCPAPKTAVILGVSLVMPYTLLCDFAAMIRPLLIGFAYLSAALAFFGFAKK